MQRRTKRRRNKRTINEINQQIEAIDTIQNTHIIHIEVDDDIGKDDSMDTNTLSSVREMKRRRRRNIDWTEKTLNNTSVGEPKCTDKQESANQSVSHSI